MIIQGFAVANPESRKENEAQINGIAAAGKDPGSDQRSSSFARMDSQSRAGANSRAARPPAIAKARTMSAFRQPRSRSPTRRRRWEKTIATRIRLREKAEARQAAAGRSEYDWLLPLMVLSAHRLPPGPPWIMLKRSRLSRLLNARWSRGSSAIDAKAKPRGSLGRIEALAVHIGLITRNR